MNKSSYWKYEWRPLAIIATVFLIFYFVPFSNLQSGNFFLNPIYEALALAQDYARKHVILCLLPAFFIAGAISVFISRDSVIRYLGPKANQVLAYGVASVSGSILAVCSCTILPLFAGIYRMGAGLGPATAFLYSGPAINVLAIILTARILGPELGIARAVGAVVFGIAIGILMHFIFRNEEDSGNGVEMMLSDEPSRPLWKNALYFGAMAGILVFANWAEPGDESGFWFAVFSVKWLITSLFAGALGVMLIVWFRMKWWKLVVVGAGVAILAILFPRWHLIPFAAGIIGISYFTSTSTDENDETAEWFDSTWGYAKQIMPLLFYGVLVAGALMGRDADHAGLIPPEWISTLVGGNSIFANFFASIVGAFMYFATLTEVPILEGLIGNGMGNGPALALLLAGPALSLPNMLVIRSVIGTKKTVVFVGLVVVMATITGIIFGSIYG